MWCSLNNNVQSLCVIIPSTITVIGLLWRVIKRYPSIIIMKKTDENQFLIQQCQSLNEYRPTPWLFNGHLMTMFGVIFRPLLSLEFERILVKVDNNGGTVAVDWHTKPQHRQPILVILHGLTGGSDNEYIRWMVFEAKKRLDLCCVVVHARGCGRSELTSPKSFCAADTDDVRVSLEYIRSVIGRDTPMFVVGYSLGAGILTKYLGEESDQCTVDGAVVCCASFDMHLSTYNLEQWLYVHIYNRRLTKNLIEYLRRHEKHFKKSESEIKLNHAYEAKTVREFDTHVIVPQFGFRDVEHYYTEASPNKWIKHIRVPTLILSAIDDPICPIKGLPEEDILANSNMIAVKTLEGGHVSYLRGWWPKSYSYDNIIVVEYVKARLKQMAYQWTKEACAQSTIDISIPQEQ